MDEQWEEFGLDYARMRFVWDALPDNEDTGFTPNYRSNL